MSTSTFIIKRHDTLPVLTAVLKDANEEVINLTDTSVYFTMKNIDTDSVKIDTKLCSITNATSGIVQYTWEETDTDTAGEYLGEFEIVYDSGKMTIPTVDSLVIVILEDYNNR